MLIYGLKNCDKCRAARKVFQQADFIDIRRLPFPGLRLLLFLIATAKI